MTKRFRQASLSFESLAVAVEDSEDLQVQQGGRKIGVLQLQWVEGGGGGAII